MLGIGVPDFGHADIANPSMYAYYVCLGLALISSLEVPLLL